MGSQTHSSDGGRERYERIAAAAGELAQLLMTLQTLATLNAADMSGLVVENLTSLVLDDAAALAPHSVRSSRLSSASRSARRDHVTRWPRPADDAEGELITIDAKTAITSGLLSDAISRARQACKALAAAGGAIDLRLLSEIAAALKRISTCYHTLGQLGHERTRVLSSLPSTRTTPSPRAALDIDAPIRTTTLDGSIAYERVARPAPAKRPRHDLRGGLGSIGRDEL